MSSDREPSVALFAEERHRSVLDRLRTSGKVTVEELAAAFHVSAATVRADLARMEQQGLLRRTHGGAIRVEGTVFEPHYDQRQVIRHAEKRAIARAAAAMVKPGETVLLDAGTTTYEIALRLKDIRPLTVVTNSLATAGALMENPDIEVVLVGGSVQHRRKATLGPLAVTFLQPFHFDRAFVAVNGVHAGAGLTVVDFDAAEVKRQMIRHSREAVVVADAGKLGRVAFASVCQLAEVRMLVTDPTADEAVLAGIRETGLDVRVAPD